jgi:hypothetical protein
MEIRAHKYESLVECTHWKYIFTIIIAVQYYTKRNKKYIVELREFYI